MEDEKSKGKKPGFPSDAVESSATDDLRKTLEFCGLIFSLPSIPFRRESMMPSLFFPFKFQRIEEREDASSILIFESSSPHPHRATTQVLRRDCGPFLQLTLWKGVMVNQPGFVAAVGGIPDELKLDGGISFSFPYPTFMIPKMLPTDLTDRYRAMREIYKEGTKRIGYENAFVQAYQNALASSSSTCKQSKEEEEARNIDQQPMVEVNIIPSPVHHLISPTGSLEAFGRDCGDFFQVQYTGVLVNKPGFVAAIGGIPDELKIRGGISFSFPAPTFKVPKNLPKDPTERRKVVSLVYYKAVGNKFYKRSIIHAYKKARLSSNSEQSKDEEKAHKKELETVSMIEVNIDPCQGTGSLFGVLMT